MVKAVLFDMDGVLINSEEALYRLYSDCLKEFGFPAKSRGEIMEYNGLTDVDWLPKIADGISGGVLRRMLEWTGKSYAEFYVPKYARPAPGVKEALSAIRAKGVKTAVVSNQREMELKSSIALVGFDFDCVVSFEKVGKPKPSPEPLWEALRCLGVEKGDALYVGDSMTDVLAGRNAGIETVLVASGLNGGIAARKVKTLADLVGMV